MGGEEGALGGEEEAGVVVFLRGGGVLWDGAAEEIGFCFGGEGGEGVVGGGLRRGRGGREQGFGVFGEVLAAVGGIEAFGEDDEVGAVAGGFEDAGARVGEVGGFVGAWWYTVGLRLWMGGEMEELEGTCG